MYLSFFLASGKLFVQPFDLPKILPVTLLCALLSPFLQQLKQLSDLMVQSVEALAPGQTKEKQASPHKYINSPKNNWQLEL